MKIEVLGPNINPSDVDFSVVGDKITFGMAALKGVGEQRCRRSSMNETPTVRSRISSI